ncbi:hypothetical protein [Belliella aquatica]|uniref:hypothetical protein n=1 Tax=Belliella aquatica TaxID=1323734 RepID=UPI00166C432F|nr:hypothetical protein [Belliella aquatica]MCH7406305.1 hypothetical protein [Belliella aquatica]
MKEEQIIHTHQKISQIVNSLINDNTFQTSHISIGLALIHEFLLNGGSEFFRISRRKIMKHSQVKSLGTYHRCMKELVKKNLITYNPSYHPKLGSEVSFV